MYHFGDSEGQQYEQIISFTSVVHHNEYISTTSRVVELEYYTVKGWNVNTRRFPFQSSR
jgi:hypothetical protein